jgi:hypothetical protein
MQLTMTSDEMRLLLRHLTARIEHLDGELVHTDKRELQRSLATELDALRALCERLGSVSAVAEAEARPDVV